METRGDRQRILDACGIGGRAPKAHTDKFLETGVIDGSLWPIQLPVFHVEHGGADGVG